MDTKYLWTECQFTVGVFLRCDFCTKKQKGMFHSLIKTISTNKLIIASDSVCMFRNMNYKSIILIETLCKQQQFDGKKVLGLAKNTTSLNKLISVLSQDSG